MSWDAENPETKIGNLGQQYVIDFYRSWAHCFASPYGPHVVDMMVSAGGSHPHQYFVEVKTKPKRDSPWNDTGCDLRHWHKYLRLSKEHDMPLLLAFVDQDAGAIYGEFIHMLAAPIPAWTYPEQRKDYPLVVQTQKGPIIFFRPEMMFRIAWLTNAQIAALAALRPAKPCKPPPPQFGFEF